MPTFANLTAYVDTVTGKLTKPRRGVGGAEGVRAADVLSALVDCGTYVTERVPVYISVGNHAAMLELGTPVAPVVWVVKVANDEVKNPGNTTIYEKWPDGDIIWVAGFKI